MLAKLVQLLWSSLMCNWHNAAILALLHLKYDSNQKSFQSKANGPCPPPPHIPYSDRGLGRFPMMPWDRNLPVNRSIDITFPQTTCESSVNNIVSVGRFPSTSSFTWLSAQNPHFTSSCSWFDVIIIAFLLTQAFYFWRVTLLHGSHTCACLVALAASGCCTEAGVSEANDDNVITIYRLLSLS